VSDPARPDAAQKVLGLQRGADGKGSAISARAL
jgi:hypothetical protein